MHLKDTLPDDMQDSKGTLPDDMQDSKGTAQNDDTCDTYDLQLLSLDACCNSD
jgi:hypothetical protein